MDKLQLRCRKYRMAHTIRRNLQAIFKKSDRPTGQYDDPQRQTFEFQMSVPRERHKYIRSKQQNYRYTILHAH